MENNDRTNLTSAEMGKLWSTYVGNSMAKCVLNYYLQHVDDQDIKNVVKNALHLSEKLVEEIKEIFIQESFPVPNGFTENDVNLHAPRLFADEFYLYYLNYVITAGMSIYSIAIPLMTRKDTEHFFIDTLHATIKLITEIKHVLMEKGLYVKPPHIPTPEKVDFVKKQKYLNGFFGDIRPLHALEIAHLESNIENNVASKALLIGFSQVAKDEKIRQFFIRGKELTNKHIEICSQQLHKDNLPSSPLLDNVVTTSTVAPFSDKLMLAHKIEMFTMKIRTVGNGLSLNGRKDLGAMYTKMLADIGLYVEDASNIAIDHGWMEQIPQAADRDKLSKS